MPRLKLCKCGCGEKIDRDEGVVVNMSFFISFDHASRHGISKSQKQRDRQQAKAKQSQAKEEKANRKAVRELKNKDRKHQFQLTKKVIQKWVHKVRDAGLPCISCETTNPNIVYSGGHYRTAGGNPEIALESRNIHRQCLFNCNKNKSGNISGDKHSKGFKQGLIDRHGQGHVDWLDGHHESNRLDCDQLRELRAYYNRLIRENKKTDEDRPFF